MGSLKAEVMRFLNKKVTVRDITDKVYNGELVDMGEDCLVIATQGTKTVINLNNVITIEGVGHHPTL